VLIKSSLTSYSNQQNLFITRPSHLRHIAVYTCVILGFIGCLSIDTKSPECFPAEDCERGTMCVEGRCITPPLRSVTIKLGCLTGDGCSEELSMRRVTESCLIIEQPNAIFSSPFALDQARFDDGATLSIPLMSGPVRSSVLLLTNPPESFQETSLCALTPDELERYQLHRSCPESLGCILRLRHEEVSVLHTDTDLVTLDFSGPQMSCAESVWSAERPSEICGGADRDCDGFFDEGVQCSSPQDDLERTQTP
jgi:hypothetical protein